MSGALGVEASLRKVCAWCGKVMDEGAPGAPVSHGICRKCFDCFSVAGEETFQDFLDSLELPVLVVNSNVTIMGGNRKAAEFIGKELPEVKSLLGGEALECAYSRLPGGCGKTVHCGGCVIRKTVTATWNDGKSRLYVEGYLDSGDPKVPARTRIFVSAEKVGDFVFLKVETEQ